VKASLEWIKELLPELKASSTMVERKLNASGTAVDGVDVMANRLEGVVVGEVRSVQPHPKADKLRVTRVFDGERDHVVVCGAPNVAEGQKVPFAPVGVALPNGLEIATRSIRGVESSGMLCSADELGLVESSDGLLLLNPRTKAGKPVAEVLKIRDVIYDLDVTPNRPDLLSHFGLARELAALFDLAAPKISRRKLRKRSSTAKVELTVSASERCPQYSARLIEGVRVGPSPDWVQRRLLALGQRPVSNVVDATNLVLLQLGQPLHAFDLERLAGPEIVVRMAQTGEEIQLLDGASLKLTEDDLVIADAERPVALAGVMGGKDSEVDASTTRILLESAQFDPSGTRRTARRYGLHTEASHRFERGVDPEQVRAALDVCAELIVELAGGEVTSDPMVVDRRRSKRSVVPLRPARAELLLGRPVNRAEIRRTLRRLGLEAEAAKGGAKSKRASETLKFRVPSWRVDLNLEVDLIEEVARIAGYDEIPTQMPSAPSAVRTEAVRRPPEQRARAALAGLGFNEAVSLGFASARDAEILGCPARDLVAVKNPLGEETRYLRFSLLSGLLSAAQRNQDALPSMTDLRLFELGRSFRWTSEARELPREQPTVALLLRGRQRPQSWSTPSDLVDVHDLVGVLELLFERMQLARPLITAESVSWLHPRASGRLDHGGEFVGRFGQLHPDVMSAYGLEGPEVFVAELDLDAFARLERSPVFNPVGVLPPAQRDLSFFVDREQSASTILRTIEAAGAEHALESVRLFDVYEGQGVPEGQRSLAVALTFRAASETLTDARVDAAQADIVRALESAHGARLRSG